MKRRITTFLVSFILFHSFVVHAQNTASFADAPEGKHTIRVYPRATNPKRYSHEKTILVKAGNTYYIALDFHGYQAPTPIVIHPLTEDLAQMILPSLKQDKSCSGKE